MKTIKTDQFLKVAKKKEWDPNPWATCEVSVGKKKDPEAFERCVLDVKKKQSKEEGEAKEAQYTPAMEEEFVDQQLALDRRNRDLEMRRRGPTGGKIKSRRKQIQEIDPTKTMTPDEQFEYYLNKRKNRELQEPILAKKNIKSTKYRVLADVKNRKRGQYEGDYSGGLYQEREKEEMYKLRDEFNRLGKGEITIIDLGHNEFAFGLIIEGETLNLFQEGRNPNAREVVRRIKEMIIEENKKEQYPQDTPMGLEDDNPVAGMDY